MEKIKLAVYNEYALGYIMPERPDTFYTLKDSVLRGAPWRVMREPYFIGPNATVRLASRKDFEDFGLSFEGYDDPMYEFDTTLSHNRRTSKQINYKPLNSSALWKTSFRPKKTSYRWPWPTFSPVPTTRASDSMKQPSPNSPQASAGRGSCNLSACRPLRDYLRRTPLSRLAHGGTGGNPGYRLGRFGRGGPRDGRDGKPAT